jgi:DNA-binding protein H-NS
VQGFLSLLTKREPRLAKSAELNVRNKHLATTSVDELWILHDQICGILSTKMDAKMQELARRLVLLNAHIENKPKARRPYPKVHPKYRNPERPFETWSGRGKQPRWVASQLAAGTKSEELLIPRTHQNTGTSTACPSASG